MSKSSKNNLKQMQKWIAYTSVGPSTLRGYQSGLAARLKELLFQTDLDSLTHMPVIEFSAWLNDETIRVFEAMPKGCRYWGAARKVLNIFLRGATYNHFLRQQFRLDRSESELEVPLDRLSAKKLIQLQKENHTDERLPRWHGIKYLTHHQSDQFQNFAKEYALRKKTLRVHLDIWFWVRDGQPKDD